VRRRARVLLLAIAASASLLVVTPAAHPQPAAVAPATISSVVEQYRDTAHVPGVAVAVTRGDRVILARGFGHTADGQEVTAATVMAMASVSKSFTALAVVQLAEQGRLELDQPVQRYLPEFVTADPRGARITARQLLDQTSGLTDAGVGQFTRPQPESLRDSVADFRDAELTSTPGSEWAYYNPNYQIAARLVEVVSGQPFDEYLADHVFTPLAMNDSRSIDTDDDLPPTAHGYLKLLGYPIPAPEPTAFGAGSGGVLSTAEDMTSWLIMQNQSTPPGTTAVVSPESLKTMHSPSSSVSGDYALGWSVGRTPSGAPHISHRGDLFTSTAYQALLPDSRYGIAVMANTGLAYGDASAIGKRLVALLAGEPAPGSAQTVAVDGVLLGIALLTLALGTIGIIRARRWATTHTIRRALISVPLLLAPLVVLVLFPVIVRALYRGRDITWTQSFYLYPSFMILLIALSAATTLVGGARLVWKARLSEPGSRP